MHQPPPLNTPEGIPITLAFLPMYHTYGLHTFIIRAFITPTTYVLLKKWDIRIALSAVSKLVFLPLTYSSRDIELFYYLRYRITTFPLIPSVVHQIVDYLQTHKGDISSLRSIGSGAAYLSPQLAEHLASLSPKNVQFTQGKQ
jgi:acyl-CoA synthetase (AMP-forming)/AMP-acid ligase II